MDVIAGAVVKSKIKGLTKDIEGAVGLNEDQSQNEAASEARAIEEQRIRDKEVEKRRKQRQAHHSEKEKERDKIRARYQLPPKDKSSTTSNTAPRTAGPEPSDDEAKSCVVS